jgi:LCP family protein required for cell wall assembly
VVAVPALVAAVAGYVLVTHQRSRLLKIALEPDALRLVAWGCVAAIVVWVGVILATYHRSRPVRATRRQNVFGSLLAIVLSIAVAASLATGARYAMVTRDLIRTVAPNEHTATTPVIRHITQKNPWGQKKRVNLLLLGGDGGVGRTGIRTDSVILVSIDTRSGETVMFSLPRNLRNVPFPDNSPLHALYPNGFNEGDVPGESMLNAIYRNVPAYHPGALGRSDNEGADAVKLGVEGALGIPVDYYLLVNLNGFRQIVDAIGGITVNINERVPINGNTDKHILPTGYIEPGPDQHLDGFKALWFTRGRFGSTDYKRMERQRCALNAIVAQADPVTLFTRYTQLASASKKILRTDIPQKLLPAFVETSLKMKRQPIRSVVFQLSSEFNPNTPDFDYVHLAVQKALHPVVKPLRPPGARGLKGVVDAGTGVIDIPKPPASATAATDANSDCTYQPVAASGSVSTTP